MSVVCLGDLLIDFVALENGVSVGDASGFEKAPGGAPANVAVGVARLGHGSAFLGQVGDDPFGHFLSGVLEAEGVNVNGLRFSTQARTGLAFVSLELNGERSFVFYRNPSADQLYTPEDVALDVIAPAEIFHYVSIPLIDEPCRSATLKAVQYALDSGLLVSYDVNLRLMLWPDEAMARQVVLDTLKYAHVLKLSDEEVEFLTGGKEVAPLWRDATQLIVVTHGELGATAYTRDGKVIKQPGNRVKAVDTTGAGDGFMAALLVGILENKADYVDKLADILRFANIAGALTTTNRGAIPALPFRKQVDLLMGAS
jgi:fructokinase